MVSGSATVAFAVVWIGLGWRFRDRFDRTAADGRAFTTASVRRDLARVVASREIQLLVVVGTMYLLLVHGLQGWLTTVFEHRGLSPGDAARVTSLLVGAQILGTVVVPPLADRYDSRRLAVTLAGVACTVGVSLLLVVEGALVVAVLSILAVGAGLGGISPLIRTLPVEFDGIGEDLTATAVSLVFAIGESGGFLGPFLVGALRDSTGSFVPGLALLAAGSIVIVASGLAMRLVDGRASPGVRQVNYRD